MGLLGIYLGCFGFDDNARSAAQFVCRMQNRGIWTLFWPYLCFAPSVATTVHGDTIGA